MEKSVSVYVNGLEQDKEGKKKFDKYEIERAINTIMEADEILENKELMKEVKKKISKASKKIGSIDDLRKLAEKPNYGIGEMDEGDEETSDDKAEEENKEDRTKNSKNPTVVGKVMK